MSNYDRLLEEAKKQGANLAKNYVPELYNILVQEEKLDPKDAGDRVKKDLALIWSPATIRKNLPDEALHEEKDTSNKDIEESAIPVSHIVVQQSTSGSTTNEPVTDEPDNERFGMGVVPMSDEKPKTRNMRMVMSAGQFSGLGKGMLKKLEEKGWNVDYAIEYDANEKALYVDVADKGEARNVND